MKTLVTGGAGFIGSHLAEALLKEGHKVTVCDNYSNGRPQNLGHLKGYPNLDVHQVDVATDDLDPYFKGIDWVFHLAALADIVPSIERPLDYHSSNVDGTVRVLEASRKFGVKRFLYAASSSCYGIPEVYPTPETAPLRPMYPYALTKAVGEQYALHWGQVYGLSIVCLRLFNVYGPRSRTSGTYGAVFGVFIAQKIHGKPFTVVGDGRQTRDFTFVTDAARAFIAAAQSSLRNEIFNVGSGSPTSVNRIVELLNGSSTHIPKRPGEPDRTHADISKIKKMLGWKPQVAIEEGVKILLENIDHWREAPVWTPEAIARATQAWFDNLGVK
ncbi:MAG: SDR family oxidoreductase [Elusimicrobia bacterium]|nr:SDR family oxidoreductase [Elusimicrobiota bacterium]